jgi:hypothetical protein
MLWIECYLSDSLVAYHSCEPSPIKTKHNLSSASNRETTLSNYHVILSRAKVKIETTLTLKSWLRGGNDDPLPANDTDLRCLGPPFLATNFALSLIVSPYHQVEGAPRSLPPLPSTFAFFEFIHNLGFRTFLCRRRSPLNNTTSLPNINRSLDIADHNGFRGLRFVMQPGISTVMFHGGSDQDDCGIAWD